jgi:4'-phosphopantetheinyl transferase
VHVWHADPGAFETAEARRACLDLLDEGETARLGRFRVEVDRTTYLVAHALLRSVLSVHAPADPRSWRFAAGPHGKPSVAAPSEHRDISFNLSHARGRVAVAVALGREVGVDVEDAARAGALEDLADRYLSPVEVCALRALHPKARRERFLACWTLKESYLKARGTGLSLPLSALTFHLDEGPAVRATFDPSTRDDPARWAFALLAPGPGHPAAVAIQREPGEELAVCVREVLELPHPH